MLGLERQRDLFGCDELACMTEIAGALDVEKVISARVALLHEDWTITAKLIAVQGTPEVLARTTHFISGGPSNVVKALKAVAKGLFSEETQSAERAAQRRPGWEQFRRAEIARSVFDDFEASGMDYEVWIARRNKESLLLEITKWALTVTSAVAVVLFFTTVDAYDRDDVAPFLAIPLVLAGGSWGLDLADLGELPAQLPRPRETARASSLRHGVGGRSEAWGLTLGFEL